MATVFTFLIDMIDCMKHTYIMHQFVFLLAGFVGAGMLSGAVAGSVFASPPARNVLQAIRCVSQGNEGKNVTCDIIIYHGQFCKTLTPLSV
jgi:dihydroxyacetone kinase